MVKYLKKHIHGKKKIILFIFTILFICLSLADVIRGMFNFPVNIIIYSFAGISFFLSCILGYDMSIRLIRYVVKPKIQKNKFTRRLTNDYGFSTIIMTLPGTFVNVVFALTNACMGIYLKSAWAGSLAAYYIGLSALRITVVSYSKHLVFKEKYQSIGREKELKLQKNCGLALILMSIVLSGAVLMLLYGKGGKQYNPIFTIAIAAYTFYKLAMSIKNLVKSRKNKNPLMVILGYIGHADALVSLLYLQTALFFAFGTGAKMELIMNGITGGCIILATIGLGLAMIMDAKKKQQTEE